MLVEKSKKVIKFDGKAETCASILDLFKDNHKFFIQIHNKGMVILKFAEDAGDASDGDFRDFESFNLHENEYVVFNSITDDLEVLNESEFNKRYTILPE
ncbi:MAG: hypothetical protein WC783_02905 [Candidatus Paceibacterota bacterium]|jgi:hypothetical protein